MQVRCDSPRAALEVAFTTVAKGGWILPFADNTEWMKLCDRVMTQAEVQRLADAIQEDYFFELFLDGLPIWGFIGDAPEVDPILADATGEERTSFVYSHYSFEIGYNGPYVVSVNVTHVAQDRVQLHPSSPDGQTISYSYSISWKKVDVAWEDRMDVYKQHHDLPTPLEVHWLSIINSLILVLLLTACLAIIMLRVINHDFTVVADVEAGEASGGTDDEIGWKLVHGDVFRKPSNLNLLTAAVGSGAHLYITTVCLLFAIVSGWVHAARRGSILATTIVIYTATTAVGGFVSARLFRKLSGTDDHSWAWNILISSESLHGPPRALCPPAHGKALDDSLHRHAAATAATADDDDEDDIVCIVLPGPMCAVVLFPAVVGGCFVYVNTTAFTHSSSQAVPFGTILIVLCLFLLVGIPLGIIGGVVGRRTRVYKAPARPSARPRKIPSAPFWRSWPVQLCLAGFLPFSAISVEMHFIFSAVWGHKVYTMFGILLIAFFLLTIVTACIVVGLAYFQLACEDYHWWWRSFISGGMVGVFLFAYALYFYHKHTDMTGMLQASFFFAYMGLTAASLFLMFGSIGFSAAFAFVHYIYSFSKSE